jgi:hypothetical protein
VAICFIEQNDSECRDLQLYQSRFFIICVLPRETHGFMGITLARAKKLKICSDRFILLIRFLYQKKKLKQIGTVPEK